MVATLALNDIRQAILDAVTRNYRSFPTSDAGPLNSLAPGKELDIDFTFSNGLTGPGNGDPEFVYTNIGDANPNVGFMGQAGLGCVRNSTGVTTVAPDTIFGQTLIDSISSLVGLAWRTQAAHRKP